MTLSRARIAACFVVIGGAAPACAAVISIGDPALDTYEAGTLPVEASTPQDTSSTPQDATVADAADAADAAPTTGLRCGGGLTCAAPAACCTYSVRQSTNFKYSCASTCPAPDQTERSLYTLKCTQRSDCPGQKCCLYIAQYSTSGSATCKSSCPQGEFDLCAPAGGATACSSGQTCGAFTQGFPSVFAYCR